MNATGIVFSPLVPEWALWGLAALLALAAIAAAARGMKGWIWRALAGAAIVAALANPALVRELREPLADIALVIRDVSASMDVQDREQTAEAAAARIRDFAQADPSLDLVEAEGGPSEDGTRLMDTIRAGLSDIPRDRLAGVIVLSDGQIHDVPSDPGALGLDAPLHLFATGDPDATDRRLVIEQAPAYGIVGDAITFTVRVEDEGEPAGSAQVRLSVDGGDPITARVPIGESVEVQALVQNRGQNVVEIEVEPGRSELSLLNNRAAVSVTGVRDRLRVLLVTGEPHNGARAWRNLLKSDPSVDLVHFTILRPLDKGDNVPDHELALIAFPIFELFEVQLSEFDLVIFDRYRRRGILPLAYFDNIARYVDNGGALLVTTGPPFAGPESMARTPLINALPARPTGEIAEGRFVPRVSDAGERHPVTAPMLGGQDEWGPWYRRIGGQAISGETLLEGPEGDPLLVLSRQGQGRAAILLSDQAWLWARGYEGGGPHDELFRRTAHWLMGEPELDEERLTAVVSGETLEVTRTTLDDRAPPLQIEWADGQSEELPMTETAPGRFTAATDVAALGLIRLRSGDLTTVASAGPLNPLEYADMTVDPDGLRPLNRATGGGSFLLGAGPEPAMPDLRRPRAGAAQAGSNWAGLQRNGAYTVSEAERTPLAPGLLIAALILALMGGAWRREGR
jgi:hypothetical protein